MTSYQGQCGTVPDFICWALKMTHKTFFTSDLHFGHKNIIKYCNRPFATVQEMDEEMIARINARVGEQDHLWILGDFAFCTEERIIEILEKIKCAKGLIKGNHDNGKTFKSDDIREQLSLGYFPFEHTIKLGDDTIFLKHFPMFTWNKSHLDDNYHLFGHVHGQYRKSLWSNKTIDVGVDAWNFYPQTWEELKNAMLTLPQRVLE